MGGTAQVEEMMNVHLGRLDLENTIASIFGYKDHIT